MVSSDINGPWAVEMEDNSVSLALVRYMSSKEGGLVPAFLGISVDSQVLGAG